MQHDVYVTKLRIFFFPLKCKSCLHGKMHFFTSKIEYSVDSFEKT